MAQRGDGYVDESMPGQLMVILRAKQPYKNPLLLKKAKDSDGGRPSGKDTKDSYGGGLSGKDNSKQDRSAWQA